MCLLSGASLSDITYTVADSRVDVGRLMQSAGLALDIVSHQGLFESVIFDFDVASRATELAH